MRITAAFDFRKSIRSGGGQTLSLGLGDLPAPSGRLHPQWGLEFPLESGGFTMAAGRVMSDAQGSLEIVFRLRTLPHETPLIQAWGQYLPLVKLTGGGLEITHLWPIRVVWQLDTEYTLRLDWDCRAGMSAQLKARGQATQTQRRRRSWQAFAQRYLPFSVGGMATAPRFREWTGNFDGWVKSLVLHDQPRGVPGPAARADDGSRIAAPMAAAKGITVLAWDDPPIQPDPLALVQLPDRLADLRKTREVCGLDAVVAHCRSELETFTMLTWHLGQMWPHSNYWPWRAGEQRDIFWKRGHELLPDIAAGEAGGMCGGYAHMMEEVFWSFGIDARRIQVRGHSSFEAYSNELGRWIICDASYNTSCHLLAGPDGRPVGAGDVIRAHERSEYDPTALAGFATLICDRENLRPKLLTDTAHGYPGQQTDHYDSIGIALNKTAQYGKTTATDKGDHAHAWYYMPCDRPYFTGSSPMGGNNQLVADLSTLYPSRNRTAVTTRWTQPGSVLSLDLSPVGVTFFSHFEIDIDGTPKRLRTNTIDWQLHAGVNRLSVRTVNALGTRGYPCSIMLHRQAD